MLKKTIFIPLSLFILCNKCQAQGTWNNLSNVLNNGAWVQAICPDTINNILYVGGLFDSVGLYPDYGLARWNGVNWDTINMPSNFPDTSYWVRALIMYHDTLVVGFKDGNVGEYYDKNWKFLRPLNGWINCFGIYEDTLYVGGAFSQTLVKRNGYNWIEVDSEYCCDNEVYAMTVYNGDLIVGGIFDSMANVAAAGIASYNGNQWTSLDNGVTLNGIGGGEVNALANYNGKLYVGGNFSKVDTLNSYGQAVWNGINWDTLPSITGGYGFALQVFNNNLFMGGVGNYYAALLSYNGNSFSAIDSGILLNNAYCMAVWNGSLFIGGTFYNIGNISANGIAKWTPDTPHLSVNYLSQICIGNSDTLKATGARNYSWSPSVGLSSTSGDTVIASPTVTTTYTLTATNLLDSLQIDTVTVTIIVIPKIPLKILPSYSQFCNSGNVILMVLGGGSDFVWSPSTGLSVTTGDSVMASPTLSVTYTITGLDSMGCMATGNDTINVVQSPNMPSFIQLNDTLISSSLHENQWYRNDTLLVGDTSKDLIIDTQGWYWVSVTNEANGCSTPSDSMDIITLGIEQLAANNNNLLIYPNPSSNEINIVSTKNKNIDDIKFTNLLGQLIYESQPKQTHFTFDIQEDGMYFVTVLSDNEITTQKVIVVK